MHVTSTGTEISAIITKMWYVIWTCQMRYFIVPKFDNYISVVTKTVVGSPESYQDFHHKSH